MTETILRLLTRLSEAGDDAILTGAVARPFQGPLFERLLSRRVLVEDARLTEWDVCDRCDCGLASRPIRSVGGEQFRAECPLDQAQDVNLTEDDLLVYRVEAAGLASVIGAAAGFKDAPSQLVEGLWQLGAFPSGSVVFLSFEAAALTSEAIVATLRQAAQGQDVTILVPAIPPAAAKRLRNAGLHMVETVSVMVPVAGGLGVAIDPATLKPPPGPGSLRVRSASAEVEWLGRSVVLSHQLFPVFQRLLAKAKTRDQVASGPEVEGTTGREAKDLIRELRAALVAAGFTKAEAETLIATARGRGYRLGVPASGIQIDG
ncbi:hypothetical protein [Tabrizicola sp. TH137]|uniref:hypothetical protein n=1 Tax=Tabrizicola sp. TH137 TaxID=2067452 RepID=UPI00117EBEA1|nr:hypothetical protein [Tabrizicola sp. TH137]